MTAKAAKITKTEPKFTTKGSGNRHSSIGNRQCRGLLRGLTAQVALQRNQRLGHAAGLALDNESSDRHPLRLTMLR